MVNLNTIKNWFKTGLKPTQAQFWDTWDSFWHKDEKIPTTAIDGLETRFVEKADMEAFTGHLGDGQAHKALFDAKAEKIHTHTIAEVTGLQGGLDGKAGIAHVSDADAHSELLALKADKTDVYTIAEVDVKLTSVMAYKGNVATVVALPNVGNKVGDTYNVSADGMNYAWNGTTWDALGGQVDLSAYYLKTDVNALLDLKSPIVHSHEIADVTGLQGALDGKENKLNQITVRLERVGGGGGSVIRYEMYHLKLSATCSVDMTFNLNLKNPNSASLGEVTGAITCTITAGQLGGKTGGYTGPKICIGAGESISVNSVSPIWVDGKGVKFDF
ncbi:MAG: hypothetical protein K2Q03_01930 [Sphingobacteriaceae bacterium]|nr:hypothetical protein [Sphingobacteriaceae bacterium]